MAKINIEDLPEDQKVTKAEMNKVVGGAALTSLQRPLGQLQYPNAEVPMETIGTSLPSRRIGADPRMSGLYMCENQCG
jgi:hypothetical protein